MLARLRSLNIADRRDVLLFTVVGVLVFAGILGLALTGLIGKLFALLLVLGGALVVSVVPMLTWDRGAPRPIARLMVRLGLALQIFGTLITPVGLYYETNPVISVPVGFAAFLTVFFGVFVSGFGGNMLAPARA